MLMIKHLRFLLLALVAMAVSANVHAQAVTIDFSGADNWGIGTTNVTEAKTYTYGGYTIKLTPSSGCYFRWYDSGNILLGKTGATIELPAFDFDVERIDVEGTSSASTYVKQNIFVGDEAVSTETTGAKGVTNKYAIAEGKQAAGTLYTLKVTSSHNTQIAKIMIYKKGEGGSDEPEQKTFDGETVADIAAFNALASNTEARLTLTDAKVLFVNDYSGTKEIFVKDAKGAVDLYNLGIDAKAGQVLNGTVVGKRSARSGFVYAMVKGGDYSDGLNVTVTDGDDPKPVVVGVDEVAGFYCDLVKLEGVTITGSGNSMKATADGAEVALYDRFQLKLISGLKTDGTKYDITGLAYDGGASYGVELVVTGVTLAGGGEVVDEPATPVASIEALLGLTSPSANLELTLTDAKVLVIDGNYVYVRENGKALCLYQMNDIKAVLKANALVSGKVRADFEVYRLLPEIKANKHTVADNLTVTESEEEAVPVAATVADIAAGKNVCDLVIVKGKKKMETTDGGSNTYYIEDGDNKIVAVNNGKGLDKFEDGAEVTVIGIVNTANDKYQVKIFKSVEETTGINAVKADMQQGQAYNMAGQKVSDNYRGLIIRDGKKIMVK